jgi:hypothetical protein
MCAHRKPVPACMSVFPSSCCFFPLSLLSPGPCARLRTVAHEPRTELGVSARRHGESPLVCAHTHLRGEASRTPLQSSPRAGAPIRKLLRGSTTRQVQSWWEAGSGRRAPPQPCGVPSHRGAHVRMWPHILLRASLLHSRSCSSAEGRVWVERSWLLPHAWPGRGSWAAAAGRRDKAGGGGGRGKGHQKWRTSALMYNTRSCEHPLLPYLHMAMSWRRPPRARGRQGEPAHYNHSRQHPECATTPSHEPCVHDGDLCAVASLSLRVRDLCVSRRSFLPRVGSGSLTADPTEGNEEGWRGQHTAAPEKRNRIRAPPCPPTKLL